MPAAPHPELTAQQKQHISDRTDATPGSGIQQLPRRLLPNGSVAERVLMFEKSPSMFGEVRVPPQRKEPTLTGTSITPWRAGVQELQVGHTEPRHSEKILVRETLLGNRTFCCSLHPLQKSILFF